MTALYTKAYEIAQAGHAGQFRKNGTTPYFTHPIAVAKYVEEDYRREHGGGELAAIYEDILEMYLVVAIAHDLIEDVPEATIDGFAEQLRPYGSAMQIAEIKEALDLVTKKQGESYFKYLEKLKEHHMARYVKLRDLRHNMSDLPEGKQLDKYRLAEYYLTH